MLKELKLQGVILLVIAHCSARALNLIRWDLESYKFEGHMRGRSYQQAPNKHSLSLVRHYIKFLQLQHLNIASISPTMSFDLSLGDFVTISTLITDARQAIDAAFGSGDEFREAKAKLVAIEDAFRIFERIGLDNLKAEETSLLKKHELDIREFSKQLSRNLFDNLRAPLSRGRARRNILSLTMNSNRPLYSSPIQQLPSTIEL